MRNVLVVMILLLSAQAQAATIHFGNGQVKGDIAAAFVGALDGDDFIAHGPLTENNQTVTWAWNNCTLTVVGGDYVFDGSGVTQDGIIISGTGNTLDLLGGDGSQMKWTGYGRYVFWVNAASNIVNDPYLYDNGYVGEPDCRNYMLYANSTLNRPVIASGVDNNGRHYGVFISGSGGGSITDMTMAAITQTGASSRVYGILAIGAVGNVLVDGFTMTGGTSVQNTYGLYWSGTGAGDVMVARRIRLSNLTSTGACYPLYAYQKGMDIQDFSIDSCKGGVYVQSPVAFVGTVNAISNGVVYGTTGSGMVAVCDVAGSNPTVSNLIVRDSSTNGFLSSGAHDPISDNNLAYNNGTDWNGWTMGADDLTVDPEHVDAATGDFHLLPASPAIDAGAWIDGRTSDMDGQPMSGPEMDIGAYEFQQQNRRTIRTAITRPVTIPTRDERSAR